MPRGSKDKYTDKQKRKAEHIEESYESRGVSTDEAQARAWATVNKQSGGGEKKGGSGQKKSPQAKSASRKSSARRAVATKHGVPRPDQSLESMTKAELLNRARTRHIPGRSTMRKQELINALRHAA
ncbi:Rho termination factor N-terminal domain-containing protein [Pseudomonas sp. ZM23]|uniref:Rho termination factor N-terminal domain-containing protein n=1 Tax=Pseudomonas triclosanedens TaxID=2961893 RepID=A0ABY7A5Q8_9PSED|nr:Rho termination factor N-terminal domain-containing protein [Pseudomonas triclosanedens]MCP8466246.1 Rho termination factor N-terminal domain-containing protein [Pseudomonas triclosanedens]MCP8471772.1 Rho termination factor N-terminal domain-containing protein [Pseudomonas triclosanedens]MCP8478875.1 Rho termination factor N-terminal domain-containing protein [Pseudomonas triclosanedens]WAI52336.1 Rho termination factor N-terminal domain-containing protein [Pseudomonas triclosanedens]